MRHPTDNRVHFSELREMRKSPMHYVHACKQAREVTRPMLVGLVADAMVFGGKGYALYPGKVRNGGEWEAFKAEHAGKFICIRSEYDDAKGAAEAVLADPVARAALEGCEYQRVMHWDLDGLPCAAGVPGERGGFDAWKTGTIYDLKMTASADPDELSRHALRMCWHAQGAWYLDGARELSIDVERFTLICVESSAPWPVSVVRMPAALLEQGRRALRIWTERLKACEASNAWPGYLQSEIELEVPEWIEAVA